jgi:hypothetical protein
MSRTRGDTKKRGDKPGVTVRLTEEEDAKVRHAAAKMGMDVSDSFRRAWALSISILLNNDYARRVEIDDVRID